MSCEIRSMMTSYFFGSSIRMPPIFTNSAVTPSTFMELIFSTTAGGNVFSIPKTIPIFLALTGHSSPRVAHLKTTTALARHPQRSEGPLYCSLHKLPPPAVLTLLARDGHRPRPTANAKRPLKIFPRHLQPQRPVMPRIIPPNIQPIWNRLGIQHR